MKSSRYIPNETVAYICAAARIVSIAPKELPENKRKFFRSRHDNIDVIHANYVVRKGIVFG